MATPDELFWQRVLVCSSGLVYWLGVLIQGRRIRKQIGKSPNLKPRGGREKALWLGWFLVIVVWIGQPLVVTTFGRIPGLILWRTLVNPFTLVAGAALAGLGYGGTLWCYAAMGNTWRIGINKREKTELVRRGPYRWLRHPIYLFQVVMLAGAALLLPTTIAFVALVVQYVCALIKARDEERYLETVHGAAYSEYLATTGGLMPRLNRKPAKQDIFAAK